MTTIRDIFNAFAPESLERHPTLPASHHTVLSAIPNCRSGHDGHRLSQCQSCDTHHRVHHSWGPRHCPQCQPHQTQQWLQHHLDTQLPGPPFLVTCTVPAPLRPFIRSPQRLASQALFTASSQALKRLAQEERFIGTHLPGFPGILHPWGRQLQAHPHLHSMGPGGGLAADRTTWLPSRANFSVPVKALAPLSRALFKEAMDQAGLLAQIDPLVWHPTWNVHSQAPPTATRPAQTSPRTSSRSPSPPAASVRSRTAPSLSPPVNLAVRAHAPPPSTSWHCSAGSSSTSCPMAS